MLEAQESGGIFGKHGAGLPECAAGEIQQIVQGLYHGERTSCSGAAVRQPGVSAFHHKTLGTQAVGAVRHPGSHDAVGYRDNPVRTLNF